MEYSLRIMEFLTNKRFDIADFVRVYDRWLLAGSEFLCGDYLVPDFFGIDAIDLCNYLSNGAR